MKLTLALVSLIALSLGGMHFYFQSLDNTPHPTYEIPQYELPSDVFLNGIDPATGLLQHQGWAKTPNKISYNPNMSKVYWPVLDRQKQWNYFYIMTEDYLVTMAHANIGVIKSAYVNILDIKSGDIKETVVRDYFNKHVFIDVIKNGDGVYSSVDHPDLKMKFVKPQGDANVDISFKSDTQGYDLDGHFVGNLDANEGLTVLENHSPDGAYNAYNTKIPLEMTGQLKVDGKVLIDCSKTTCLGLHDNGRSIGKYMNTWVWGSTAFRVPSKDGKTTHKVTLNLCMTMEGMTVSGDAIFVDGKLYKLDTLVLNKKDNVWSIESYQGKNTKYKENQIKLQFKVHKRHTITENLVLIQIDFNSNYGYYSGSIKTADHDLKFGDKFGLLEEMFSRW